MKLEYHADTDSLHSDLSSRLRRRLYELLASAEADVRRGDRGLLLAKVVAILRKARR